MLGQWFAGTYKIRDSSAQSFGLIEHVQCILCQRFTRCLNRWYAGMSTAYPNCQEGMLLGQGFVFLFLFAFVTSLSDKEQSKSRCLTKLLPHFPRQFSTEDQGGKEIAPRNHNTMGPESHKRDSIDGTRYVGPHDQQHIDWDTMPRCCRIDSAAPREVKNEWAGEYYFGVRNGLISLDLPPIPGRRGEGDSRLRHILRWTVFKTCRSGFRSINTTEEVLV